MRQRSTLGITVLLLLFAAGWLLFSPKKLAPGCKVALTIVGITNGPTGGGLATLRLANIGDRRVQVLPVYGVEAQPAKVDASMLGNLSSGIWTLRPGEACTNTLALPSLAGRSWRVFFRYWEARGPVSHFGHYWLMRFGLARREEPGLVAYTDWVTPPPGTQPPGTVDQTQSLPPEPNQIPSAAGPAR